MSVSVHKTVDVVVKFKVLRTSEHEVHLKLLEGYKVGELVKAVREYLSPKSTICDMEVEEKEAK